MKKNKKIKTKKRTSTIKARSKQIVDSVIFPDCDSYYFTIWEG